MWPPLLLAIPDEAMTEALEEEVQQAALSPAEHLVDAGYVSARVFVNRQEHFGIEVVGPCRVILNGRPALRPALMEVPFVLDWEHQQATCPTSGKPAAVGPPSAASTILI